MAAAFLERGRTIRHQVSLVAHDPTRCSSRDARGCRPSRVSDAKVPCRRKHAVSCFSRKNTRNKHAVSSSFLPQLAIDSTKQANILACCGYADAAATSHRLLMLLLGVQEFHAIQQSFSVIGISAERARKQLLCLRTVARDFSGEDVVRY